MRIVDLSMPMESHFRWNPEITITGDVAAGDTFRVTRIATTCHGFTHVDAAAHFVAHAPTIETTPLDKVVGWCRVFDLSGCPDNTAIGPDQLAAADPGGEEGDIFLLAAKWDTRRDYRTPSFWTEAPWLTREAAEWILSKKPSALAVDFPQDYPIRLLLEKVMAPTPEHVTHDVLLRNGVTLIEYIVNTSALTQKRIILSAAPLKIPTADGAPARAFAIEGLAA